MKSIWIIYEQDAHNGNSRVIGICSTKKNAIRLIKKFEGSRWTADDEYNINCINQTQCRECGENYTIMGVELNQWILL